MKLSKSKIFLILCLSLTLGVLVGPILPKIVLILAAIMFVVLGSIGFSNKAALVFAFAGLTLLAGSLRFQTSIAKNNLENFYGRNAQIEGVVSKEPDLRDDKTLLTLSKLKISDEFVDDEILVAVYPYRNFNYGDRISLIGKIQEPVVFDDFNYKNYLARYGIHAVVYYPAKNDLLEPRQGNKLVAALLNVKHKFIENLTGVLPEPQNAFLAGLLIGNKRAIPQKYIDDFNATGTSHIIAISGYNITIIVWALEYALSRFGKKTSTIASILTILAFVILTGASASVIRAAVMGGLVLVAKNIGRLSRMTNAMAVTAAGMILINPLILHYDVGFQLSFAALLGLVYLTPVIEKYFQFLPGILSKVLVATLAAQIFALPILLFNFDQLSLIAPLTNVLVLELVPLTMLFGFLTGLAGFIWLPFSAIFSWPTWILLSYILKVVDLTAKIPFATLSMHLNLPGLISYYVLLIALLAYVKMRGRHELERDLGLQSVLYKA